MLVLLISHDLRGGFVLFFFSYFAGINGDVSERSQSECLRARCVNMLCTVLTQAAQQQMSQFQR